MTHPGRSAYSLKLLKENLELYTTIEIRSLRWNEHYQRALEIVAHDVQALTGGKYLKPMAIEAVAASDQLKHTLKKNAGYMAFETGKRSKGENMDEAIKWCLEHLQECLELGTWGRPLVMGHRSSNSKPIDSTHWKWKCRIILMQDLIQMLYEGHFAIPFIELFKSCPWGEGSMSQEQVRSWIMIKRRQYQNWYSSDYSQFDVHQAPWLLEDVMNRIVRPLFGEMSEQDNRWFDVYVHDYIHKDIHGFDGVHHADGCQVSGALTTYAYNTIVNQVIDLTVLLMQGCNPDDFRSLKCGDDNLTFYRDGTGWDRETHCQLIQKYFGIKTTLDEKDCGRSDRSDPVFLSRKWTDNGEERNLNEVIWNLIFPERYREYDPDVTGVNKRRAVALVLAAACREQQATMRKYFDIPQILYDAGVKRLESDEIYTALAAMGTGFNTPWIQFRHSSGELTA
jgi:hypothetical protein